MTKPVSARALTFTCRRKIANRITIRVLLRPARLGLQTPEGAPIYIGKAAGEGFSNRF